MHVPDGFINATVSIGAGVVAAGGVAVCLRKARGEVDERLVPMAGLAAAFIFAVQMLNFPVGAGTSGHLMGGTLAALLVGPYVGALAVTVVLIVQALLFADGGLTALGVNVLNVGLITAFAGYGLFVLLVRLLPKNKAVVIVAGGVAAGVSVPLAALAFVAEYAIGATTSVPLATVAAAMGGVHLAIGVGEGLITAATLAAVLAARPDLVHGARHLRASTRRTSSPLTAEG
ncbi:energy-coupling factor ABC transporter permease [Salinactinospora qingdaonensis]|uniref:Cobalt/nickel transport system permease protein n=1 Tax=Salinactinospora qingdaonensis TaxID=702744 RepID=A0ABP7GBI8_9ACTN